MKPNYAAQWGYCDAAAVEECKKQTHDLLIAGLGESRRSGVSWYVWTVAECQLASAMSGMVIPADIVAHFAKWPGGRVVLALAEAQRTDAEL